MSEELKQQRTREQWPKCNPKMMAQQSPAAIMYALQDAKRDITALYRHADNLRAELSRLEQECDSVAGKLRAALLDKAQIEAERAAALKQVEGLRQDAERYRLYREGFEDPDAFDANVDAALQAKP